MVGSGQVMSGKVWLGLVWLGDVGYGGDMPGLVRFGYMSS